MLRGCSRPLHVLHVSSSEGSEGQPGIEHPRAFSCIKFSAESSVQTTSASGAEAEAGESESGQELLAVSASMRLYHVTNVPIAAIKVGRWVVVVVVVVTVTCVSYSLCLLWYHRNAHDQKS